jgi:hypothetical protein
MTKDQAKLAAQLCKLAYVDQIAKQPSKRDALFRKWTNEQIHEMIEKLEDMAEGEWV